MKVKKDKDLLEELNQLKKNYKQLEKCFEQYQFLNEKLVLAQRQVLLKGPTESNLNHVFSICLELAVTLSGIGSGGIYIVDNHTGDFNLAASKNLSRKFHQRVCFIKKNSENARLLRKGIPVYKEGFSDSSFLDAVMRQERFKIIAIIPFKHEGKVIGSLQLASRKLTTIPVETRNAIESIALKISNSIAWDLAEKELKKAQNLNQAYLKANPDIMFLLSGDGTFIEYHAPANQDLYISPDQFIGKNIRQVMPKAMSDLTLNKIAEAHQKKSVVIYEYSLEMDGTFYYESRMIPCGKNRFLAIVRNITEKKKMEDKLKYSELQYRNIFENAIEGIYRTSLEGQLLMANPTFAKMFGFNSPDEMIQELKSIDLELYENPLERERLKELLLTHGIVVNYEMKMKCKDGTIIWVSLSAHTVWAYDGSILYFEGIAENITERKLMDLKLKESEEKFRQIVELVQESIVMLDPEARITYANPRMAEMLEYSQSELSGLFVGELLDENGLKILKEKFENRKKGFSEVYDTNFLTKSGKILNVIISAKPILDTSGKFAGSISGILDVTTRKVAEKSLRESEARFRQIADNVNEAFWIADFPVTKLLYANKAFENIFGFVDKKVYEDIQYVRKYVHPEDLEHLKKAFASGEVFNIEYRILRATDGELRWIRNRGFPLKDPRGTIYRLVGVFTDITDYKKASDLAEQQRLHLIQADKLMSLGILVAGIAHEINNPNNYISLSLSLLRKSWESLKPFFDKHKSDLDKVYIGSMQFQEFLLNIDTLFSGISEGSQRIKRIVSDLKDYARQDTLDFSGIVDVNKIVLSSVNLMNSMIKKHTKFFFLNLFSGEILIKGNAQKLEQVVINLIHNACDALLSCDQEIRVSTELGDDQQAVIVVSDKGCGILRENLSKITDPFFTTKRNKGGTGLGLSVSAGIIKDHKGTMLFESEPGKGTKVTIILPKGE